MRGLQPGGIGGLQPGGIRRVTLFKRAPFRLALLFAALVLVAYVAGALVAARYLENGLASRLDILVRERYTTISEEYANGDRAEFIALVRHHAEVANSRSAVYQLRGNDGRLLAGNLSTRLAEEGHWPEAGMSTHDGHIVGGAVNDRYRLMRGQIDDMNLLVGLSDQNNDDVRAVVYRSAGLAMLATLLLILAGGAWLAHRSQRRLDKLGDTLQAVANGELASRLPLSSRQDDVDALATQINAMLEELQSLIVAVDQISSDVAHDLKTPISRLFISLEEAAELASPDNPVYDKLIEAQDELHGISATFEALLRLSRIEHRARRDHFTSVDLAVLLARLVDHWQPVAEEQGQQLSLDDRTSGHLCLPGDADLLTQMVVNLVTNALRYCSAGARIVVRLESHAHFARLQVLDDGPGIDPAEWERVFQRLYRLDRSRASPGFGLGLSLVKAVAALHAASVSLGDNDPGLVVTIDLPR